MRKPEGSFPPIQLASRRPALKEVYILRLSAQRHGKFLILTKNK